MNKIAYVTCVLLLLLTLGLSFALYKSKEKEKFCVCRQGRIRPECVNKDLVKKLYVEGVRTENSDLQKESPVWQDITHPDTRYQNYNDNKKM